MKNTKEEGLVDGFAGDRLYGELRALVESAPRGTRLASERDLAARYKLSVGTVRRVFLRLEKESAVYRMQGRGTFAGQAPQGTADSDAQRNGTLLYLEKWDSSSHSFFFRRLQGAIEAAELAGLSVQVRRMLTGPELCDLLSTGAITGLMTPALSPDMLRQIRAIKPHLPIVLFMENDTQPDVIHVDIDMAGATQSGIQWGLDQGALRFVVVARPGEEGECRAGANRFAGQPAVRTVLLPNDFSAAPQVLDAILADTADVLICLDDIWTLTLLQIAQVRMPALPTRYQIVSMANVGTNILPPGVARLELDGRDFGTLAVSMIQNACKAAIFGDTKLLIRPRFVKPDQSLPISATARNQISRRHGSGRMQKR